jgi:serine phosphatase RsbU (regulator of sigma subunit)
LVNIIEDWDVLKENAGEKLGFYQLLATDGMFEIRVQTGRVGFKKNL